MFSLACAENDDIGVVRVLEDVFVSRGQSVGAEARRTVVGGWAEDGMDDGMGMGDVHGGGGDLEMSSFQRLLR